MNYQDNFKLSELAIEIKSELLDDSDDIKQSYNESEVSSAQPDVK